MTARGGHRPCQSCIYSHGNTTHITEHSKREERETAEYAQRSMQQKLNCMEVRQLKKEIQAGAARGGAETKGTAKRLI